MFLQQAMEAKKILDEFKRPKVEAFSKLALDLAVALQQYDLQNCTVLDYHVSAVNLNDDGEMSYMLYVKFEREGGEYRYEEEVYVPSSVYSSVDPIAEAQLYMAMCKLGYTNMSIKNSYEALSLNFKEQREETNSIISLINQIAVTNQLKLDPLKRVELFVDKYTKYSHINYIRLDVKTVMAISGVTSSIDFAKLMTELIDKNMFKRVIILHAFNGEAIQEFDSYEEVPNEFFDPSLDRDTPVLPSCLKTVYEYIGKK